MLECFDPVAEPRRFLVAEGLGQVCEPFAEARQRTAVEEAGELLG
jgi:hypothetical protein